MVIPGTHSLVIAGYSVIRLSGQGWGKEKEGRKRTEERGGEMLPWPNPNHIPITLNRILFSTLPATARTIQPVPVHKLLGDVIAGWSSEQNNIDIVDAINK